MTSNQKSVTNKNNSTAKKKRGESPTVQTLVNKYGGGNAVNGA
jgi:hypothetical protein